MKVTITKPDATLYDGEASLVQLPGTDGLFEIMNNHAPIIAALKTGDIRLVEADREQRFAIRAGVVQSQQNKVEILVQ